MCAGKNQEVLLSAVDVPRPIFKNEFKHGKSEVIKSDDNSKSTNHTLKKVIAISEKV